MLRVRLVLSFLCGVNFLECVLLVVFIFYIYFCMGCFGFFNVDD